jgi:hypothetical protein
MATNRIVLILCALVAFGSLGRLFFVTQDHLTVPFDLAFESPNLCTIKAIQKGQNIYDPAMYENLPFLLTIYTPAYYHLVRYLPQNPNNKFFTGRIVAMVFMLFASFCLFFPYKPRDNVIISILAVGCFFLIREIVSHTAYLRHDSMALFFSAAAVVWAEKANDTPWKIVLVALFCFVAFMSKQSFLAATASCLFYFFLNGRKSGSVFATFLLFLFVIFGLFAHFHWGRGFWFSVFVAPRNPGVWAYFVENWTRMLRQPVFVFLLVSTIFASTYFVALNYRKTIIDSPFLLYVLFSALALMITIGKEGANVNCFFEPILASLLWLVFLIKKIYSTKTSRLFLISLSLLFICVIFEFALANRSDYSFTTKEKSLHMFVHINQVKKDINELQPENQRILNLAWAGLTCEIQEDPIMNDLFLYSILWNTEVLNVQSIIDNIIDQDFDIIILRKDQYRKKILETPYDYLIGTVLVCYQLRQANNYYYLTPRSVS